MRKERSLWLNVMIVLMWGLLFASLIIILIISLTSQKQTITTSETEVVKVESLTCESSELGYPFLRYDNSDEKELKIVATFDEGELKSISLRQMLYYSDESLIVQSEAENHTEMNLRFAEDELGADALNMHFAKLSDGLDFGLYAKDRIDSVTMKYFMLGDEFSFDDVKQTYEELGMICVGENTD